MITRSESISRARSIAPASLLLVSLFILGGCNSVDTLLFYYANDGSPAQWNSSGDQIRLPFKVGNFVTIPVRINKSDTMDFILDTGAPVIGLMGTDLVDRLGLDRGRSVRVGGSGSGQSPSANLVEGLTVSVGDVQIFDQTAAELPWEEISFIEFEEEPDFEGIIGYDLLKRYVVRLDFDQNVMTLYKPDSYEYEGTGKSLPLEMSQRKPYTHAGVTLSDGQDVTVKLHVDLGSRSHLSLIPGSLPQITLPADAVRADGVGLSRSVQGYRGRVEELRLGAHTLKSVVTKFHTWGHATANGRQGVLGLRVLERFNVIFDYPRNRMILETRKQGK